MTKSQIRESVSRVHSKLRVILTREKNLVYSGHDDEFRDMISHFYGDLATALGTAEDIVDS